MFRNLTIHKRKDVKVATSPTHDLVASDEDYQNKTIVGAMWTRVAKDNSGNEYKFLSGTLSKNKTGTDGKSYQGYVLITEDEYNGLIALKVPSNVDTGEATNVPDEIF